MDESEQALLDAADSSSPHVARIVGHVVSDVNVHRIWECRHAELVRPVAEQNRRAPQLIELRLAETRLTHKRALINYIRKHQVTGALRDRLISAFYGSRETTDAILKEHQRYMVAVSSRVSTDHLIDVMCDPVSKDLIRMYDMAYDQYFELYCFVASSPDSAVADAVRGSMGEVASRAKRIRKMLREVRPDNRYSDFDRQAQIARSGRYPALNYLNR